MIGQTNSVSVIDKTCGIISFWIDLLKHDKTNRHTVLFLGKSGIGKTYQIKKYLKSVYGEEECKKIFKNGHITPVRYYCELYDNPEGFFFWDDISGLYTSDAGISLLKQSTETTKERIISYNSTTEKLEERDKKATGTWKQIFCMNEIPKIPEFQPILSRCKVVKLDLSYEDILSMMYEIAENSDRKEISKENRLKIVDIIKGNTTPATVNFDLRLLDDGFDIWIMCEGDEIKFIEKLRGLIETDETIALVLDLNNSYETVNKQTEEFKRITGKTKRTFQRLRKKLGLSNKQYLDKSDKSDMLYKNVNEENNNSSSQTHILVVEPNYPIRYPNLALMKLSAKHKKLGDTVEYIKGEELSFKHVPNKIYISTMFTYYAKETIRCINFYKRSFPKAELQVGGIFASLMPEYIEKHTGIKPFVGYSEELDAIVPDYSLIGGMIKYSPKIKKWKDFSILFTARGCPNKCPFCYVSKLEPKQYITPNWKEHIDLTKKYVMIQDNNLTAMPFEHFKEVIEFLIKNNLVVCFNNGVDCKILTDEHIELLSKVKWYQGGLRMAFDNMSEDGYIQTCVKKLLDKGVPKSAFSIFTMFNYTDTVEEAMYRHQEVEKLGVRPYPIPYCPANMLKKSERYVSPNWDLKTIKKFRTYWLFYGTRKKFTWEEWINTTEPY